MEFTTLCTDRTVDIIDLFRSTFTASEGAEEGDLIGNLVSEMLATVSPSDIQVFAAIDDGSLAGAVIFTRLRYPEDARTVYLLSPMAVATAHQGQGYGQALLGYALTNLRQTGVDVVLTYGDIDFYSKVGFRQISQATAQPPLSLAYPEGWLGQSLTTASLDPLRGPSFCVQPLNNPALW